MLECIVSAIRAQAIVACVKELAVFGFLAVLRDRLAGGDSLLEPFLAAEKSVDLANKIACASHTYP